MDPHFSPTSFRIQDGLVRFWHRHPGPMALVLALLIVAPFSVGFVASIVISMSDFHFFPKTLLMIITIAGTGWATMCAHDSFGINIPRGEQWDMVEKMGRDVIPTDRRLCRLEAMLIERTQGDATQAQARAHVLNNQLPKADGTSIQKGRL